jgi:alpha-L-fucosidase
MNRRELLRNLSICAPGIALGSKFHLSGQSVKAFGGTMAAGPFDASWESLSAYKIPEWFRNAKFGIWAHWGPQCAPEEGDWYARKMYVEGSGQYKAHLKKYGHPSKFGFKDVIPTWKAEQWNPEELLALYKKAGARYFMALANHHDNFDLFNSRYQKNWNATKIGPKKDLIRGWERAARNQGLYFGVSVHVMVGGA